MRWCVLLPDSENVVDGHIETLGAQLEVTTFRPKRISAGSATRGHYRPIAEVSERQLWGSVATRYELQVCGLPRHLDNPRVVLIGKF